MKITIDWQRPIVLKRPNFELVVDYNSIPIKNGLYVFGRKHGRSFEALYVGKATNLKSRIKQQLNNAKLLKHIIGSANGGRVLLVGIFKPKQG